MLAQVGSTTQPATILVADDDPHLRESIGDILSYAGHHVLQASDGKTALDILGDKPVDLLLLDLEMPRLTGMEVLKRSAAEHPEVPVVIISGRGTIRNAVESTKLGAYDFLEKPVDAQRTLLTVRNALEKASLQRERDRFVDEARERYRMIGSSPVMQQVYDLIDRAASTKSKVLIMGESGTGKEMVARAIHHNSDRAGGPFVAVNCAAIPEPLIESELFGHEKGSFTGASEKHPGKFEQAAGGTILLDEIGDMSLMTQAKTLRVLEDGVVQRVGSTQARPVDVRVIVATNRNLEEEIEEGNFREDLYYRLNIVVIRTPPLRERRDDIPDLARHFLDHFCHENGMPGRHLTERALTVLLDHDWPGNVRELRNVVERLVVLSSGTELGPRHVMSAMHRQKSPVREAQYTDLRAAREQFERDFIQRALIAHEWRIQDTADVLGINRSHLWKKMKRYDIEEPSR